MLLDELLVVVLDIMLQNKADLPSIFEMLVHVPEFEQLCLFSFEQSFGIESHLRHRMHIHHIVFVHHLHFLIKKRHIFHDLRAIISLLFTSLRLHMIIEYLLKSLYLQFYELIQNIEAFRPISSGFRCFIFRRQATDAVQQNGTSRIEFSVLTFTKKA